MAFDAFGLKTSVAAFLMMLALLEISLAALINFSGTVPGRLSLIEILNFLTADLELLCASLVLNSRTHRIGSPGICGQVQSSDLALRLDEGTARA